MIAFCFISPPTCAPILSTEPATKPACGKCLLENLRGVFALLFLGLELQRVGAGNGLERDVLQAVLEQRLAHLADINRLRVGHGHRIAALEIDAEQRLALRRHRDGARADDDAARESARAPR